METLPESFITQFRYHWKELRKSDPRLAREFGLTIEEVRRIKGMLIGNSNAIAFVEDDKVHIDRPEPAIPRRAPERETRSVPERYVRERREEPRRAAPRRKGLFASVFSGLVESSTKVGKGVLGRVNDLVFEAEERNRQEQARQRPLQLTYEDRAVELPSQAYATARESVRRKEDREDAPVDRTDMAVPDDEEKSGGIDHASRVLQKIHETVEKVEQDQELERRFSEVTARVSSDTPESTIVERPEESKNDTVADQPLVFKSSLDEVMYRQALKKLLHDRKEIRCNGIMEIERIGRNNKAALRALYPMMRDSEPDVRSQVLISLISLDVREAVFLFKEALDDENARVRMAAIRGMHKFTGKSTSQFISLALGDESAEVREITARYIGGNGDSKSISEIFELLGKERDPSVRRTLVRTIASMREKSTIPCIISMLNDPSADFRVLAARTLEELTQKKFNFNGNGFFAEREKALEEIKQWWAKEKETFQIQAKVRQTAKQASQPVAAAVPGPAIKPLKVAFAVNKPDTPRPEGNEKTVLHSHAERAEKPVEPVTPESAEKPVKAVTPAPAEERAGPVKVPHVNKAVHQAQSGALPWAMERFTEKNASPAPQKEQSTGHQAGKRKKSVKLDFDALGIR